MNQGNQKPSRREFLLGGFAGAVAWSAARQQPVGKPAEIRFGFTSYTWGNDWDLTTMIANCEKAQAYGLELRTDMSFAHKVELDLSPQQCSEVRRRFADSPVKLVGLACGERDRRAHV